MNRWVIIVGLLVSTTGLRALSAAEPPSYRKDLIRITDQRIPMDPEVAALCVGPEPVLGPHSVAEVHIYVNKTVRDYRRKNPDQFAYPIGSKFLKEKYPTPGSKAPTIATVMTKKRDEGKVSDWEFEIFSIQFEQMSLSELTELKQRKDVSCADCHSKYKERGFISKVSEAALRQYLASEAIEIEPTKKRNF